MPFLLPFPDLQPEITGLEISHTPSSTLLRSGDGPASALTTLPSIQSETLGLGGLLHDLLALCKDDFDVRRAAHIRVDLADILAGRMPIGDRQHLHDREHGKYACVAWGPGCW